MSLPARRQPQEPGRAPWGRGPRSALGARRCSEPAAARTAPLRGSARTDPTCPPVLEHNSVFPRSGCPEATLGGAARTPRRPQIRGPAGHGPQTGFWLFLDANRCAALFPAPRILRATSVLVPERKPGGLAALEQRARGSGLSRRGAPGLRHPAHGAPVPLSGQEHTSPLLPSPGEAIRG